MIVDAGSNRQALKHFLALPREVYRGDPHYCGTSRASVLAGLYRPRFRGCQRALVAFEDDRCVARVVARRSPTLKEENGRPYGTLGFFEALERPRAIREILLEAVRWLEESGAGPIVGPMDADTWHRYRLNVGPFDRPPFLMEPYNKSYYAEAWEGSGFEGLEGYYSLRVEDVAEVVSVLEPALDRVLSDGYEFRPLDMRRFHEDLRILYELSQEIFTENFLYDEILWEDFLELYEPARPLIDPELVLFALAPDGNYAGFCFSLVDYHEAVTAVRGSRGPIAKLKWLLYRGRANAVNVKSLGVVTKHRRSGLGAALVCRTYERMLGKGYREANLCLIRDGNPSGRLDGGKGSVLRRYTLYRYTGRGVE